MSTTVWAGMVDGRPTSVRQGDCGHLWREERPDCPTCAATGHAAELDALFDLQWKRSREADVLWQAAHPLAVSYDAKTGEVIPVWPDLGELLTWLLEGEALLVRWLNLWRMVPDPFGPVDVEALARTTEGHMQSYKRPTDTPGLPGPSERVESTNPERWVPLGDGHEAHE